MKKRNIFIAFLLSSAMLVACDASDSIIDPNASTSLDNTQLQMIEDAIVGLPIASLTDSVEDGLIFMREEEKLARDVYLYLYDRYGLRIFNNIARSESQHMAALKILLDKYELKDPVVYDEIGVFQNQTLADLYKQLTAAGDVSLLEALKVGATIEDLDIRDLMEYVDETESEDVIYVYNNLTKGSRNHLRAFYSQILNNGGTYEPQFITQELFDYIINSPRERGRW